MGTLKVIGSRFCKDTLYGIHVLKRVSDDFEFIDVTDMANMRAFLKLRDEKHEVFDSVRERDGIGFPVYVLPSGAVTLDINKALGVFEG